MPQIHHPSCDCAHFHELVASGGGMKWERVGGVDFVRPDPMAIWRMPSGVAWPGGAPTYDSKSAEWNKPTRQFDFTVEPLAGVRCAVRLLSSGHIGIFPEHLPVWRALAALSPKSGDSALNLFGYTGIASLVLQRAGFEVTHVDASKPALNHARENQSLSGLPSDGLRWIAEDAMKYARREVSRGRSHRVVLADPPAFGRGPKNEVWRIEEHLADLLDLLAGMLDPADGALVLSYYAVRLSPAVVREMVATVMPDARIEVLELGLTESRGGRFLPQGFCLLAGRGPTIDQMIQKVLTAAPSP